MAGTSRIVEDLDEDEEYELTYILRGEVPPPRSEKGAAGTPAPPGPGSTHQVGLENFMERSVNRVGQAGAGVRPRGTDSGKAPSRTGQVWATVTIQSNEKNYQPKVRCNNCTWVSVAGSARIKEHILGINSVNKCTGITTEPLKKLRQSLIDERDEAFEKKRQKRNADEVDAAARGPADVTPHAPLERAFKMGNNVKVEESIARFIYAANIPAAVVRALPALCGPAARRHPNE